jgi:hypothetical protein
MYSKKVKPGSTPAGSEAGNASEGLRILAKMIARRLLTNRQGVEQKRTSSHGPDN